MKKYMLMVVLALAFIITPIFTKAQTTQDLLAEIARLQAIIAQLTEQLNQQRGFQTPFCHNFTLNLREGNGGQGYGPDSLGTRAFNAEDEAVAALIRALAAEGLLDYNQVVQPGSAGTSLRRTYFGPSVTQAVMAFQEKYASEILAPLGLARGTGFVGSSTRAVLNRLYGCGVIRPQPDVFITPTTLPPVVRGSEVQPFYRQFLQAHGFSGRLSWSITSGVLPEGFSLNPQLIVCPAVPCQPGQACCSSTETYKAFIYGHHDEATPGSYTFTVQATDGVKTAQRTYSLVVRTATTDNQPPVISGVSGPTALRVGGQGTWTVRASDPDNSNLTYSVRWGDEVDYGGIAVGEPYGPLVQQSATFTHTYSDAGTYYPTFTVTDDTGQSAQTSISVVVSPVAEKDITVLSPNGGEYWLGYSTKAIQWQIENNAVNKVDLYLWRQYGCFEDYGGHTLCIDPPPSGPQPIVLDRNINANSIYYWIVGTDIDGNLTGSGNYRVGICLAGSSALGDSCDTSDQPFHIAFPAFPTD